MTGIGRYSEMTYCFDLFKENNEFELLLSKRIEKAPQLRIALLDYLKGDKEVFPLVALRFCLYREIAENHEKRRFVVKLLNFMFNWCLDYSADSCGKLAQLIALQIHYLPQNTLLINMNSTQIEAFIENKNINFFEALIIADAYQYNTSWVNAVFNHVILNNDWNYWSDYITRRDISTSFIEELVHKYIQFISNQNVSNERVIQTKKCIQKLIQYISDFEMRFRMASKLSLTEVNHQMINEESGAYLQDLRRNGLL
ncbi:unnamed protein product [Oppiella nova]|uniref:Spatacsin C-terminal domain-containing protein n=1 Tax=Oppiella nova TaxID=334625 RepID=A0A7R9LE85_9ACAR|nr:unnamed protein product [Oppiella nova]CAG2162665.1 unnamed protein product [Oppiella nova]